MENQMTLENQMALLLWDFCHPTYHDKYAEDQYVDNEVLFLKSAKNCTHCNIDVTSENEDVYSTSENEDVYLTSENEDENINYTCQTETEDIDETRVKKRKYTKKHINSSPPTLRGVKFGHNELDEILMNKFKNEDLVLEPKKFKILLHDSDLTSAEITRMKQLRRRALSRTYSARYRQRNGCKRRKPK